MKRNGIEGFTLIELSIVLIIIGLIIGAVFTGQSLIRQSQINSAISDEQRYVQAVANFQQKYGALPGDFASATTYWGANGTCPPSAAMTAPTTCNGDGNGQITTTGSGGTYSATSAQAYNEYFLFWEHLSDAQFISGKFNGFHGSAGTQDHTLGTNAPLSRMDGAGFGVDWVGVDAGDTNYYAANYGHVFVLGGYASNNFPVGAIMTPTEAYSTDTKFDDGVPSTGNILTWVLSTGYTPACVTSATAYATMTGYKCSLIFITGF